MEETKKMNFFQKIYRSLYDFKSYIYFSTLTIGKGIVYLLLISLITGAAMATKQAVLSSGFTKDFKTSFEDKVKDFSLSDGIITVNGDKYTEINSDHFSVMFDTGNEKKPEDIKGETAILLQKDQVYVKPYGQEIRSVKYSTLPVKSISREDVMSIASDYGKVLLYGPFILYPIQLFFRGALYALILALVGLIIAKVACKVDTTFGETYNLSLYVVTPIFLITLVLFFFGWFSSLIIDVAIGAVYLYMAYKEIALSQKALK